MQTQSSSGLGNGEGLTFMTVMDFAERLIVNHDRAPQLSGVVPRWWPIGQNAQL
jgi:hypothetical protein